MMKYRKGFTVIELLIACAIIAVLVAVVIVSTKVSRNKANDTEVREALSTIQVKAQNSDIAPGVIDYSKSFSVLGVPATIAALAQKLGVPSDAYQYGVSGTEYAIIFPLKAKEGSYYCVDSLNNAREVSGLLNTTGPKSCDNATRVLASGGGGDGQNPVITFNGGDFYEPGLPGPGLCSMSACVIMYDRNDPSLDNVAIARQYGFESEMDPGVTQIQILSRFQNPPITASDPQDGDITSTLDWDYEPIFDGHNVASTAAATAVATYVNNLVGSHYSVSGCDSNYEMFYYRVQDKDYNQAQRNIAVYSCEISQ